MLAIGVASTPQNASAQLSCDDVPPPQQTALTRPIPLGISGGNVHSLIKDKKGRLTGCFSGTLGSMVQDSSNNQYILSNNHVIADQNTAKRGQGIVQPGLADLTCLQSGSDAVATFSKAIKLKFHHKNFVDAAIAAVVPGQVSPEILFIGDIASSVISTPTIGMPVQKMGRTTCLTTGVIAALNANLQVNYSETMKPRLATFVNQILVTGSVDTPQFGGPGDSGSLIVTQDDCPQAVALLFAGSADSSVTIANPISEVTTRLGVSMVGTCSAAHASDGSNADVVAGNVGVSKEAIQSAKEARDRHESQLMGVPGAVGTGIGVRDPSGQPSIEVYVTKMTPEAKATAPKDVEGTPVKLVENGGFVAY
jgi:hypothetical protein